MTKEDAEGRLILSKKRARFELAWKAIEGAAESGEPVDGTVIEVVKGGLILDLGVRGFLPASLVDIRRVQNLDEFLGEELRCKVIELNRSRNNVVLSRRAVLEDERKDMRQAILDRLSPGDVVEGTISNIVDFGAFVDLKGIDGLIHISELSWSHVNHPSEVLEIGQTVKVKVLDIDRDRQRISLGLKQTQSDPWQQVIDAYQESDVVEGRVTKVVTFGAFVEILPGVEGLVHISELAQHHVENPREIVAQGEVVHVKIIEMDADRRRLSLSLKRVEPHDDVRPPIGGAYEPAARRRGGVGRGDLPEEPPVARGRGARPPSRTSRRARGRGGCRGRAGRPTEPRSRRRACRRGPAEASDRPRRGRGRAGGVGRGPFRAAKPTPEAEVEAEPPDARTRPSLARERRDSSEAAQLFARRPSPSRSPAASAPARARCSPRSRVTVRRPSRATRSSIGCCATDPEVRERSSGASASACSTRTAASTGRRVAGIVFGDPRSSPGSRACSTPRGGRAQAVARARWRARRPTRRLRRRDPAPLRDRRRERSTWSSSSPPRPRCGRRANRPDLTRREQRLIPDEEKVLRADFAYVNDGTIEELDAFVAGVMRKLLDGRRAG